eukprot:TRINITY_DN52450_c0_g1_i1.p1 TRINITY_DN52450_c0_g1~~TRINITY_DN52450_c0_g1_i1.p1  ORF type:complete len:206 (+),score=31.38 TRINITY_DN52450_c0_g1_i1:173-790(+)
MCIRDSQLRVHGQYLQFFSKKKMKWPSLFAAFIMLLALSTEQDSSCSPSCGSNGICMSGTCYCKYPYVGKACNKKLGYDRLSYVWLGILCLLALAVGYFGVWLVYEIYRRCSKNSGYKYVDMLDENEKEREDKYLKVRFDNMSRLFNSTKKSKFPVSYTHLRAHETSLHLVCRLLLEKKKKTNLYKSLPTNKVYIFSYEFTDKTY